MYNIQELLQDLQGMIFVIKRGLIISLYSQVSTFTHFENNKFGMHKSIWRLYLKPFKNFASDKQVYSTTIRTFKYTA